MDKVVLGASATTTWAIPQDNPVLRPQIHSRVANGSINEDVNSNGRLLPSLLGQSSSSPKSALNPALAYSDIASRTTSISNLVCEDEIPLNADYGERLATIKSFSGTPSSISERRYLRCRPEPEQGDGDWVKNLWPLPKLKPAASAEISSQVPATLDVPGDVALSYSTCVTQEDAEGEVRVGWKGYATRWKKGSILKYTVCTETFESSRWAALVAGEAVKAIAMWEGVGVRFERVKRDEEATFAIRYCFEPDNCRPDVYARAFFPKTSRGELLVYQLALEPANVDFLANILAHELGHVLGLSHEFADQTSFLWGKNNDRSVMNYFSDLNQLQVGQQDREELTSYYECDAGRYKGLTISDIEPRLYHFPRGAKPSVRRRRSASKRLYLNYRVRHVRFRRGPSLVQKRDQQTKPSQVALSPLLIHCYCGFVLFASFACYSLLVRRTWA